MLFSSHSEDLFPVTDISALPRSSLIFLLHCVNMCVWVAYAHAQISQEKKERLDSFP